MTGIPLIIAFVVAIAAMILLISKLKVHPFLAIMLISLILAFVAGIRLNDLKDVDGNVVKKGITTIINEGFGNTFKSIGIVIILGAFIGTVLEKTGAALKLADMVIKVIGEKHPDLAVELMGWVVSIPVFCDSGFVILNPIRKALVKRTGKSSVAMTVCLSCGLYIAHVFIPPTPGPIAAAGYLGVAGNLLLVIGIGVLCSIFPLIAGFFYAKFIGKKIKSADETTDNGEVVKTYEELKAEFGKLPNGVITIAPLIVPILLMAASSIISMAKGTGFFADLFIFLGTPIMALAVGSVLAIVQLFLSKKGKDFYSIVNGTLKDVGPILFITAAGGVLGNVIASSNMMDFIKTNASVFQTLGIFFPFLLAAILKCAQGSSTVAITTTAAIVASMAGELGFVSPVDLALVVMAIGAGAMTVSHANDSYFWVVTNFGEMTPEQGYRTQTLMTLVIGIAAMVEIFILSLIF
ncbi:MAG: GntP family permease [Clostridia bacterium]|nr:GntP family permease [Clostridia bacterium]